MMVKENQEEQNAKDGCSHVGINRYSLVGKMVGQPQCLGMELETCLLSRLVENFSDEQVIWDRFWLCGCSVGVDRVRSTPVRVARR